MSTIIPSCCGRGWRQLPSDKVARLAISAELLVNPKPKNQTPTKCSQNVLISGLALLSVRSKKGNAGEGGGCGRPLELGLPVKTSQVGLGLRGLGPFRGFGFRSLGLRRCFAALNLQKTLDPAESIARNGTPRMKKLKSPSYSGVPNQSCMSRA